MTQQIFKFCHRGEIYSTTQLFFPKGCTLYSTDVDVEKHLFQYLITWHQRYDEWEGHVRTVATDRNFYEINFASHNGAKI